MAGNANNTLRTLGQGVMHMQTPAFIGGRILSPEQRAGLVKVDDYFVFGASDIGYGNMMSNHVAPPTWNPPPVFPAYVPPVPPGALPQWQV